MGFLVGTGLWFIKMSSLNSKGAHNDQKQADVNLEIHFRFNLYLRKNNTKCVLVHQSVEFRV